MNRSRWKAYFPIARARGTATDRRNAGRGFTLLELLVVVAIIAILISLLIPALQSVRGQARTLHCASNMRSVAIAFQLFADDRSVSGKGDSEALGPNRFRINDFQDQLYRLDEFWDGGEEPVARLQAGRQLTMCPSAAKYLEKRRGFPCGRSALAPLENVSLAFNMRLYRGTLRIGDSVVLAPVAVTSLRRDVLDHPYVPLAMDVDGAAAARAGLDPFYIAPEIPGREDPYIANRFWLPGIRHNGRINAAFVGGHVLSSPEPAAEVWNWSYTAAVGG
jgi:prepilin-type N-terminal cleavage/methylation domain-containing protein/prepilin-type processing-associated H-X9-DG protein